MTHGSTKAAGLKLLLVLGCAAGTCTLGACRDEPGQEQREAARRRIVPIEWDTVFMVAGTAEDSTLLMPFRPAAGPGGVYVADFYGNAVLRYDSAGRLLWRFGRKGAGPDEFLRIRDLKLDSGGRVWILDQVNQRLTVLSPAGAVERRVPLTGVGVAAQGVVPLRNGDALVATFDPRVPFVRVASDGRVIERGAFPWPEFRTLNHLVSQFVTGADPGSGRWVAAFQMGDGFFPFADTARGRYRGRFVESVDFPEVEQVRRGNAIETSFQTRPTISAQSISLSPTRLYVLFGGATASARQVVDMYDLADGRYISSVMLPRPVDEIAWGDGGLYVVYSDPYPHLVFWRPRVHLL